MLSNQIDTQKCLQWGQFNHIKRSLVASHMKRSFHCVRFIAAVRFLDTQETVLWVGFKCAELDIGFV